MGTVDELRKAADAGIRRSMPIDSTEQLEAALDAYDAELARLQAALTQAEAATAENLRAFCREVGKLEVELEKAEAERDAALADHTRSLLDTTFKSFQRGEVHGRAVMNADVKVLLNRLGHGVQSGHPWFAAWVLIVTESLKFKVKGKPAQPRTPEDA